MRLDKQQGSSNVEDRRGITSGQPKDCDTFSSSAI